MYSVHIELYYSIVTIISPNSKRFRMVSITIPSVENGSEPVLLTILSNGLLEPTLQMKCVPIQLLAFRSLTRYILYATTSRSRTADSACWERISRSNSSRLCTCQKYLRVS